MLPPIPRRRVYLASTIHLQSNVTLELERGAVLRGTRDMTQYDAREENPWSGFQDSSQSYFRRSLIFGEGLENVGLVGPGVIDGNDAFEPWPGTTTSPPSPWGWLLSTLAWQTNEHLFQRGPKPVALKLCRNVLIRDLTIEHAPDEAILLNGCESVLIDGYRAREVRVDGLDIVGSRDVRVMNAEIKSLDDAVAVKSSYALGRKMSCENVTITRSLVSSFVNALKIGTESVGDFRDIVFRDIVVRNLPVPSYAGLSVMSVDGGTVDGVLASNIRMINVNFPIFIRVGDRLRTPEPAPIGRVRNVTVRGITATGGLGTGASSITAVSGDAVGDGIQLRDIHIVARGGEGIESSYNPVPEIRESEGVYPDPPYLMPGTPPAYGFFFRHVRGLELHQVRLEFENPDWRAALLGEDVGGIVLDGFDAERLPDGAPSVILRRGPDSKAGSQAPDTIDPATSGRSDDQ